MASGREIRGQIRSIKSTQKITKAMEMVAGSKLRRTQQRMEASRAYASRIATLVRHLALAQGDEQRHPFLVERPEKRTAFVVVTTDRGLCGSLNINLLRTLAGAMRQRQQDDIELAVGVLGTKGAVFLRRLGVPILAEARGIGEHADDTKTQGVLKVLLDAYLAGVVDRVILAGNHFVNAMTQEPYLQTLVPVPPLAEETMAGHWDYIYEPSAAALMSPILGRFLEMQLYQAVVENAACEMAARMVAMKNASENAGELIDELSLVYNKTRQAGITRELSEIIAGAEAV